VVCHKPPISAGNCHACHDGASSGDMKISWQICLPSVGKELISGSEAASAVALVPGGAYSLHREENDRKHPWRQKQADPGVDTADDRIPSLNRHPYLLNSQNGGGCPEAGHDDPEQDEVGPAPIGWTTCGLIRNRINCRPPGGRIRTNRRLFGCSLLLFTVPPAAAQRLVKGGRIAEAGRLGLHACRQRRLVGLLRRQ
jgi:hypothetical protein